MDEAKAIRMFSVCREGFARAEAAHEELLQRLVEMVPQISENPPDRPDVVFANWPRKEEVIKVLSDYSRAKNSCQQAWLAIPEKLRPAKDF